ncbi:Kinesin-like protein KIF6 [Durusdinium trenchii]|uniref:Kinesin-like protein KIF6 n=1 Tax=Durusdinium trenchii TaxID=1381693 RepID=A0ABP0M3U8_9DINO
MWASFRNKRSDKIPWRVAMANADLITAVADVLQLPAERFFGSVTVQHLVDPSHRPEAAEAVLGGLAWRVQRWHVDSWASAVHLSLSLKGTVHALPLQPGDVYLTNAALLPHEENVDAVALQIRIALSSEADKFSGKCLKREANPPMLRLSVDATQEKSATGGRAFSGGVPECNMVMTPDVLQQCRTLVQQYLAKGMSSDEPFFCGSIDRLRACFRILRDMCLEKEGSASAEDEGRVAALEAEIKTMKLEVAQRDQEIAVMVKMLTKQSEPQSGRLPQGVWKHVRKQIVS